MAFAAAPEPWPAAECKSAYGKTACGYDCTSGFGRLRRDPLRQVHRRLRQGALRRPEQARAPRLPRRAAADGVQGGLRRPRRPPTARPATARSACADAPDGKCQAALGRVTCWSPEPLGRPHDHWGEPGVDLVEPPPVAPPPPSRPRPGEQATCRSAFGTTACGYDCVAAFGAVSAPRRRSACARRPSARSRASIRRATTGAAARRRSASRPSGKTACGYGCVVAFGDIRCAKSPNGACQAAYGEIVCSD